MRHSKVKLTWDEDDPERNHITRRALTKTEIEEGDFKAYLASSGSESESDAETNSKTNAKGKKSASRDRLRALLLGGDDDELPEGWGRGDGGEDARDVDMEITFTPGLSAEKDDKEETTLEKYERKMKEKRKKRKDELKERVIEKDEGQNSGMKDDFFDPGSEDDFTAELPNKKATKKMGKKDKTNNTVPDAPPRQESTAEELALLAASDNLNDEHKHFNLKSVLKAEKKSKRKGKKGKRKDDADDAEIQEDFSIDVRDNRFKALHEDHTFAIDPTNPQYVYSHPFIFTHISLTFTFYSFKKTKSMTALLNERSKRQQTSGGEEGEGRKKPEGNGGRSLESLVESVKRKTADAERSGNGKRRKV